MLASSLVSRVCFILTLHVATILFALPASGQTDSAKETAKQLDSPDGNSHAANFQPRAVIEASPDKTTAALRVARLLPLGDASTLVNVALTAKTPFNSEKDEEKDIGTLSGLTAGSSVRLEFGMLKWPRFLRTKEDEMDETCSTYVGRVLPGYHWSRMQTDPRPVEFNLARPAIGVSCFELLTPKGMDAAVKKVNEGAAAKAKNEGKPDPDDVAPVAGADAVLEQGLDKLQRLNEEGFEPVQGWTLAATANRQQFAFSSEAAPATVSEQNKNGRGVSLTYTLIRHASVLGIGASYEKSHKGAKEIEVCTPIGTTGSLKCANAALKPPTEETDRLLFVEFRKRYKNLATSPRVEYETGEAEFSVNIPIYFVPDEKRVLDGGLSLAWSEEDDFGVSIFVSKPFKFFD